MSGPRHGAQQQQDADDEEEDVRTDLTRLEPRADRAHAAGDAGTRVMTHAGIKVDLKVVEPDQFGNVLQHFTGSKDHNVHLRGMAVGQGVKLNEYGVFRGDEKLVGATEEDVYRALGLPWIPPELREDRGEIEAALRGELPDLVKPSDIRGDFHVHTNATDGKEPLEAMVDAARALGCSTAQIVKSLVFRDLITSAPVLVLASGPNRVDEKVIAEHLGHQVGKADADYVKASTGYSIGGVPPIGHRNPVTVFVDKDLLAFDEVWAAGTPHAVFKIPGKLTSILAEHAVISVK